MKTDFDDVLDNNKFANNYPGHGKLWQAKNVFFYRDGNEQKGFVKIAVHPNRYRSLDALLNELTQKMPDLSFGVRSIYTPKGHDRLMSLNDLNNEEHYVCSQSSKAKGIDMNKIKKPLWNFRSTNQLRFNTAPLGTGETELRIKKFERRENQKLRAPASVPESENEANFSITQRFQKTILPGLKKGQNKRILIKKNGSADYQQVVHLNRRTTRSFEHFMDDLCGIFLMPVRRLYTLEGKEVQSLSAIFNGPNTFVAAGYERFRPMPSWSDLPPISNDYRISNGHSKQKPLAKQSFSKGQWIVRIETLDTEPDSGTTANVFLTIYGKSRATDPIPLNIPLNLNSSPKSPFQGGQIDEFEVITGNIGDIIKIRLNHDNKGDAPDWLVGAVQMENKDTKELLVFTFNRWFSQSKDGNEISRELPAIYEGGFMLPVVKYRIVIMTGDCWNAGTEGRVFICLYGDQGDTGPRQLLKSLFQATKLFEKGHSDTFEIESVSVGRLKKLVIGHNAVGPGYGWFLDKVIVQSIPLSSENQISEVEIVFPCNRWLDHGEDDGKTTRELKPLDNLQHTAMEKEMWEYEKWKFQKGNVIILFSQATWKCVKINTDGSVDALGDEKHPESHFEVIVGDRPDVCSFKSASLTNRILTMRGTEVTGNSSKGVSMADSEFKIRVQPDRTVVLETVRYINHHIMVSSDNSSLMESRGPVSLPGKAFFVFCKGVFRNKTVVSFSTSLIQTLAVTHDNSLTATGKRNRTAHFLVHQILDDQKYCMFESLVFSGQFIRMKNGRCDCKGSGEKDCLFKVEKHKEHGYITLQSVENRGLYLGMNPDGTVKPTVDTGNKNVRFYPEIIKSGPLPQRSQRIEPKVLETEKLSKRLSIESFTLSTLPPSNTINVAELSNTAEEKDYYTEGDWKVSVYSSQTAERCEVILIIYGEEGCSGPIILGKSGDKNELFQAGSINEFKINMPIIGYLYKVRVELKPVHVGVSPFWCLQQIVMENIVTDERYIFPFNNRFFGRGYDDNELSREAVALTPEESIPIVKYKVWLLTGTEPGADCGAPISITLYGEYGDSGEREFYSPILDVEPSFRRGMTDQMSIECAYLGELRKCKATVHTQSADTGWFCQKIVVEDPLTQTQVTFPGNTWFDPQKGDGKTSKILEAEGYKPFENDSDQTIDYNSENVDEIHRQAKELIEAITEQAANHVEKFHESQLKLLENGHSERKKPTGSV